MKYLALDIGGSAIKYAVMTEELEFLERGSEKAPLDSIDSFVNVIGSIYDKYKRDICGMAISMPGLLDSKKGYAYTGGALEYNNGQNIVEILKKRCNTEITIENDGKCAALAELWKGSLKVLKYIKKNVDKVYDIVGLNIPRPEITRCKFKNDANLIGALYNFLGLENLDEIRDII